MIPLAPPPPCPPPSLCPSPRAGGRVSPVPDRRSEHSLRVGGKRKLCVIEVDMDATTDDEEAEPALELRSVPQPFLPRARLRAPVSAAIAVSDSPIHTAQEQPRFERGGRHRSGVPGGQRGDDQGRRAPHGLGARESKSWRRLGTGMPRCLPRSPLAARARRSMLATRRSTLAARRSTLDARRSTLDA